MKKATLRLDTDAEGNPAWLLTYSAGQQFNVLLLAGNLADAIKESLSLTGMKRENLDVESVS